MATKRSSYAESTTSNTNSNGATTPKKVLQKASPKTKSPKPKTPKKGSVAKEKEKDKFAVSVAELVSQLGQEKGTREKTPSLKSVEREKKDEKLEKQPEKQEKREKTSEKEPEESKELKDPREHVPPKPREIIPKEPQKRSEQKRSANQPKSQMDGVCAVVARKKGQKYKWGQVDKDDISCNNEKTEFLENAQLTKLMSQADVKAFVGGLLAVGMDADETSCRDTVEEVDSEMQDIAFSPLLVGIAKEEEKAYGALLNPLEQKEKKQETA